MEIRWYQSSNSYSVFVFPLCTVLVIGKRISTDWSALNRGAFDWEKLIAVFMKPQLALQAIENMLCRTLTKEETSYIIGIETEEKSLLELLRQPINDYNTRPVLPFEGYDIPAEELEKHAERTQSDHRDSGFGDDLRDLTRR